MGKNAGIKTFCNIVPGTIRDLLSLLIEQKVKIILKSGEEEKIEIEAVVGDLVVASICDEDKIKFIDVHCICAVIVECEDILENILRDWKC